MDASNFARTCGIVSSAFADMPMSLRLDMSFNRNTIGRFAEEPDPLDIMPPPTCPVPSAPTPEISVAELAATLGAFKFPVRTDGVRGLLWGPFKNAPQEQDEKVIITVTDWDESSRTDSGSSAATAEAETTCTAPEPLLKQQRIFPILRAPIIVLIKPDLKRRRDSTDEEDHCIRVAKAERLGEDEGLPSIVVVSRFATGVHTRTQVTDPLSSSRLQYGS